MTILPSLDCAAIDERAILSVNGRKLQNPLIRETYASSIAQRAFVNPARLCRKSIAEGLR
jgi:hypothetical protein